MFQVDEAKYSGLFCFLKNPEIWLLVLFQNQMESFRISHRTRNFLFHYSLYIIATIQENDLAAMCMVTSTSRRIWTRQAGEKIFLSRLESACV